MTQKPALKCKPLEEVDALPVAHACSSNRKPPLPAMGQAHKTGPYAQIEAAKIHDGELAAVVHLGEHIDVPRPCPEGEGAHGIEIQPPTQAGSG